MATAKPVLITCARTAAMVPTTTRATAAGTVAHRGMAHLKESTEVAKPVPLVAAMVVPLVAAMVVLLVAVTVVLLVAGTVVLLVAGTLVLLVVAMVVSRAVTAEVGTSLPCKTNRTEHE